MYYKIKKLKKRIKDYFRFKRNMRKAKKAGFIYITEMPGKFTKYLELFEWLNSNIGEDRYMLIQVKNDENDYGQTGAFCFKTKEDQTIFLITKVV